MKNSNLKTILIATRVTPHVKAIIDQAAKREGLTVSECRITITKNNSCIFVKQWSCPVEEDEIPLNICHLCIEDQKTQNAFVTVNRVETPNLIEQEVIEDGWTSFLSLDREFENEEIDIEEYLQKRKDVLKKIGKAKNIRYSSFFRHIKHKFCLKCNNYIRIYEIFCI